MANDVRDIIFRTYATEAAALAGLADKRMALALDTDRLIFMDGVTPKYFWDSVSLAGQTSLLGAALIGIDGITGITPDGGSSGAASTVRAMIRGLAGTGNTNFIHNGTSQQASSNFNISGAGTIGTTLGIGGSRTEGVLHVLGGSAGSVTAPTDADEVVIEGSGATGLTFLSPAANAMRINWGTPTDNALANIKVDQPNTRMEVGTTETGWTLSLRAGNNVEVLSSTASILTIGIQTLLGGNTAFGATAANQIHFSDASNFTVSSANLGWNGTTLAVTGNQTLSGTLTLSALSSGRIPVLSTAGLIIQDNLYWDATNDRVGIGAGASSPVDSLHISKANSGTVVSAGIYNTSNTASSAALLSLFTGGTSAGDPYMLFEISGGAEWSLGVDNTDGDAFIIAGSDTLGTTNRLKIATDGTFTLSGDILATGASMALSSSQAGGNVSLSVDNSSSAGGSSALMGLSVGGTGAGDPYLSFSIQAGADWTAGVDNSDSDAFVISESGALGTNNRLKIASGGAVTLGLSGSFTGTFTGMTGSVTATCYWQKIDSLVILNVLAATGTSNTTGLTITGAPAAIFPTRQQFCAVNDVIDNGTYYSGSVIVETSGVMTLYIKTAVNTQLTNSFTNSGTKGISAFTIAYQTN